MKSNVTIGDKSSGPSFPIVGIGASAGGLNALQCFLAALPEQFGFAIVFIQHLSSKHKSLLPALLSARRPSLAIQEISDGLKMQPGRLYLSPPGKETKIVKGVLQVSDPSKEHVHLPIDEFLASLAEEAAERSVAVIFSGAGTDGARGCQAVRSAGGTVFVQDPETAEFAGMPGAAISTGQADGVHSPEDIAREILKLPGIGIAAVDLEYPITPEEYESFFRLLQEKTGSRFNHYKKSVVSRRIKRRMYLHGLSAIKDYLDLISSSDPDAAHLAADLMIGVTSFFRDRVAWKALNMEAVRKIVSEDTQLPVRVWTPASATGEEAYSIAMTLLKELALAGKKRDIHVFATDVNDRALERAREGKYPSSITADVPQEFVQKYFTSTEEGNFLVINKDVRERVVFARQDLLTDPPFSKLDLIICRNFLIYLEPEAQEKSITLFHYALKEGGFLFLGNAETVGRKSALFKSIGHKQCRIYRKLETKSASRLPLSVPYATERQAPPAKQAQMAKQSRSAMEIIQEKLLEEYGPASVAIDQNYEIIYHNGPTNRYLRQPRGAPTQNFLELVPENLRSRIRGALYRSGHEERPVVIRTSVDGDDNRKRQVSLRITKAAENLYLVVFHEKNAASKEEAAEQVDATVIEETAIHQLESELSATRADLQSHIEQLKSLNEELQSSNEELQAANEELETSREELQSLNEELITVNSQLQGKIEEQDTTNNDLNNFLASTNIPTIFLDTQFRLKRFTPAMLKLIKLLPSDVSRPIVDMSQENLGPDLIADAQTVLESLVPARQELELGGIWYVRTVLPYRTSDNRIEGVVITYTDVADIKKAEERTRHLASFPQLNPNPVIEVTSSGIVTFFNPGTEEILHGLGIDEGNVDVFLPADFDGILRQLQKEEEACLYREVTIKERVFSEIVQLIPQFNVARIYAYDVTDRKRAEKAIQESQKQNEFLANIIELSSQAFGVGYPDGRLGLINDAFEQLTGYSAGELRSIDWTKVLTPPDWIEIEQQKLEELHHTGRPVRYEKEYIRKDGTRVPIELLVHLMTDAEGKPQYYYSFLTDITERKRAEEVLRESEMRFRALVTASSDVVYRMNPDWSEMRQLSGQNFIADTETPSGDWLQRYIHPDDQAHVMAVIDEAIRTKSIFELEHRVLRVDGSLGWTFSRAIPLLDANGEIVEWFGAASDVTEHKQAEETLRANEAKYRSLFENMIDGFAYHRIVTDESGKPVDYIFLEVNDAFEKLTGLKRADIIGKSVREALPGIETDPADWIGTYGRVALTGGETRFEQHAGALDKWYSVTAYSPLKDHFVTIFEDITERRRAEATLLRLNKALKALSDSSQAVIRAQDEPEYLNDVCRIIVEDCGYSMVWIGFAENDEQKSVRPVAYSGFDEGYLETLHITWAETERGRGPTGTAIRTGKVAVCRNMLTDPAFAPWREEAIKRGYASSIVFPFRADDKVFGALTIYSKEADPFSEEEVKLLGELTDDLTYGIMTLRMKVARKAAETALQESEERLRLFIEHAPAALAMFDREMRYLSVSRRWLSDYKLGDRDLLGVSHYEIFPETSEEWKNAHRRALAGEVLQAEGDRFERADGSVQWVRWEIRPWYDAAGAISGIVIFSEDITNMKQAEEVLRRYELLSGSSRDIILFLRLADGRVLDANAAAAKAYGYDRDELLGLSIRDLRAADTLDLTSAQMAEADAHGILFETVHRRKDGSNFPVEVSSQGATLNGTRTLISVIRDITDRKKTEREREITVEFLHLVNSSAGTEDLIKAAATFLQEQSGCEALGIRLKKGDDFPYYEARGFPKEFVLAENSLCSKDAAGDVLRDTIGNPVLACMCGNIICGRFDPIKDFFSKGGSFWTNSTTEMLARTTDADRQARTRNRCHGEGYESVALIPLRVGQEQLGLIQLNDRRKGMFSPETIALWERLAGYLSIAIVKFRAEEDVLKLSEDMATRNVELESANRELEAFIYSVSHDLRAPIRHMSSFSKFLMEGYTDRLDEQGRDFLMRINKGSEKMGQLIEDLLYLSKISRQSIKRTNIDMSKLASSIVADLRGAGPSRSVEVNIAEGLTAYADQRLIEIALSNLLGNAWKFTSKIENAHIEFGAIGQDGKTVYFVRDNGAGFNPEYIGKMFRPFQRLHSEKEFEGTGIGLAIVERVIRSHSGMVWAEGAVGKGATVYFAIE